MKKILVGYIIDGKHSGIDKYLLNFLKVVSKEAKVDFLTTKIDENLKEMLKKYNSELIEIPKLRKINKQYKKMKEIFRNGNYDIAYFNISETFNCIGIYAAYRSGIKKILIHSHSSGSDKHNPINRYICHILNGIFNKVIYKWGTDYLACSKKAGYWLYPKSIVDSTNFSVIYNSIETEKFIFNEKVRKNIREELDWNNKVILGNIGNFCYQKNQIFLIKLIKKLNKIDTKYHLVLIGTGRDLEKIKRKVNKEGLNQSVTFLGLRNNVNQLLQGMDIFLLPSRFEGLPIVGVEAQFSGLPCIFSNKITEEVLLMENSLTEQLKIEKWIKKIMEYSELKRTKMFPKENAIEKYSIAKQQQQFLEIIK